MDEKISSTQKLHLCRFFTKSKTCFNLVEIYEMQSMWYDRVVDYWKQMKSVVRRNSFRNVMDMNSNLGGFASSLRDKDVWVMNVAPVNSSARLKIIYDRGLIGTVHDWCVSLIIVPFSLTCAFVVCICYQSIPLA